MEHHANHVPLLYAAKDVGFEVRHVPLTEDGRLDLEAARELVADGRVRFLAMEHVSNVLGTRNDVAAMTALVRDANEDCVVLVDGTQAVPQMPVSFRDLDVDFYALTGHKMCGPTGIGALVARPELLEEMPPFLTGGEMIRDVTFEKVTWNEVPHKFEAGTPDVVGAIGLATALDYLTEIGMERVRAHERELTDYARATGARKSSVVISAVREWLRMQAHPGIIFVTTVTGERRAALAGGPQAWTVAQAWQQHKGGERTPAVVADALGLAPVDVETALAYWADYRDEIDGLIERHHASQDQALAAWQRRRALNAV
jgi:selenocysteine lyase/cysteine desulfurase